ncbi:hypothetical protein ABB37_06901 [Leptomonas pyrrhocoris]|uniref:Uncharacterized protein n=1 Tax=Leptomonas pyrrhocoris TaxID=157538 RepID=A0A0N0DTH9_LEPPY|nr:hypothetical protein ABB37_06901 [Leptomonas pyrrhocoris]KPA77518.1 hypothetical protein ABB37_06901 [Leptomonas pyrrhocoris]|eukprot:XP_015655957.1 hypothetical protein ABB37_06901 [Leptomonas pyrrhocoris]
MSESHGVATAAPSSSPSPFAAALPYPNALQARHTTAAHRRTAAAAVLGYRDGLADEQARLQNDELVLSEEETARLQRRVEWQRSANAAAAQLRQRACDVVANLQDSEDVGHGSNDDDDPQHTNSPHGTENTIDVFHAACDGDVAALAAWVSGVPPASLPARVNVVGQPDPATYNGVQFQQRWLFRASPLIFAAAFGREEAVRFLLAHGADPGVKSSTGLRAVDYAAKRRYTNIVAMLRGGQ